MMSRTIARICFNEPECNACCNLLLLRCAPVKSHQALSMHPSIGLASDGVSSALGRKWRPHRPRRPNGGHRVSPSETADRPTDRPPASFSNQQSARSRQQSEQQLPPPSSFFTVL